MTLTEQVYAQAQVLAGALTDQQKPLLQMLCRASAAGLQNRLREGLTVDDCRADFLAAASLLALSALNGTNPRGIPEQLSVGEMTVKPKPGDTASRCLRNQAEFIMAPYLKDGFSFLGV